MQQAQSEIAAQQNLVLTPKDWDLLENPPPANPALKSALAEYR
jgi:uncharacterized protein (DUF1778 family)